MRLQTKIATAFLALSLAAPLALAQDPGADPGQGPDGPGAHHAVWARARGGDRGRGDWGHGEGMRNRQPGLMLARLVNNPEIRQRLGITDDQAAKIRQQSSDFRKNEIRQRADLAVKRVELHDLFTAENPDKAAIDAKLGEISAARLASEKSRVDFFFSMRDALTPDQRAKLKDMMRESHEHRGGFGQHHMGPGDHGKPPAPGGQPDSNPPAGPGN